MTAATFILMYKKPQDPAASAAALKFFDWAYANGDKMAEELDYVPMPPEMRQGPGPRRVEGQADGGRQAAAGGLSRQ